jgi:hypothetical protein
MLPPNFLDAASAIESNGSFREYFERLAVRDPRAYMSFLGKAVTRLLQPEGAGLAALIHERSDFGIGLAGA